MSMCNTDPFWDYLYQLRQSGILCDIQLFVKNQQDEFVSIYAHKVILAASSCYFQSCLSQGELLDIYNFDGIHIENLLIVLDYMYHQISWDELQSNAEATIAAKTLGIMEQVSPPDHHILDRSVLKDTDGNKVLLVKRFATGRKTSSEAVAKISPLSKRVILPHDEIAKLILHRRNTRPSARNHAVKLVVNEVDEAPNQNLSEGADGVMDSIQLIGMTHEEGEMLNADEATQQTMFNNNTTSDVSNLPLQPQNSQANSVVVDQQGIVTLYTGTKEEGGISTGESDVRCQQLSHTTGVENSTQVCEQLCEEPCVHQVAALASTEEHLLLNTGQDSDGIVDRIQDGDDGCSEESAGATGSDVVKRNDVTTENTSVLSGGNCGAGNETIIVSVNDDKTAAVDDVSFVSDDPATVTTVEASMASIPDTVTPQSESSDSVYKTNSQQQVLDDYDVNADNNDKVKTSKMPSEIDTKVDPPKSDNVSPQKQEGSSCKKTEKIHQEKTEKSVIVVDTPQRSRRIRRPPPDEIYEWTMPSLCRHSNDPTRVASDGSIGEAPLQHTPHKLRRARVVIKKEAETAPSEDAADAKLVMSLGDGEPTMIRMRSKRKAVQQNEDEPPDHCEKKKQKVTPNEDDSEAASPVKQMSTRASKTAASDTPEDAPVRRRRGRPRFKKEIKEEPTTFTTNTSKRSAAKSNVQMVSDSRPCVCSWCGKIFKNETGLSIHENWIHKGLGQREGLLSYECSVCKKVCKSFAALCNHEVQKHNMKREWPCETCGVVFAKAKELKKHMMREHNEQRYKCNVCQATFVSREGWKIHMYKQHTDAKPCHMCDMCGKVFKMKHELKIHCKITHSTRRDSACQLCERSFKNNVTLTRHLLTYHSDVRNHHCDVCKRAFKTNMDMKKHRDRHFREVAPLTKEGKRVRKHPDGLDYPCQFCGKIFYKRYLATAHENLQHRQKDQGVSYTCTVCDKVFPIKHYLMQHISNKHRPRRFKCQRCQREFAQQYEIRKHQQHPGRCQGRTDIMKPYECEHCGRKFTLKGNLTKHMQAVGRCRRVHQSQVIDYIVVVEETGGEESTTQASTESLETAEALATLQTAQALQLLQNPDTLQTSSQVTGAQELHLLQGAAEEGAGEEGAGEGIQQLGEEQVMGEEEMGTMLHITDGMGTEGQVHILEIQPGDGVDPSQQIHISEELAAQLGGTQENIIVQIVPSKGQGGEGGYEETR